MKEWKGMQNGGENRQNIEEEEGLEATAVNMGQKANVERTFVSTERSSRTCQGLWEMPLVTSILKALPDGMIMN